MAFRKRLLIGSTSVAAMLCATPALADTATATTTSTATATATDTGGNAVSEIVVTGIKQSLQKAIEIKRAAVDQVDAISAVDIGKLPDHNAADALQRIPGINTESAASGEGGFDENDRVSIRGTSPSLTQVTIDGHSVATGDWFILDQYQTVGRSVSFNLLPSELVSGEEVYKTQDATLLEGGVAGVVNLTTQKPLDFGKQFTVEASAEAAYESLSQSTKPQVDGLLSWHNADDTFGILVQGFYEDRTIRRYGQETLGYTAITATEPAGIAFPSLVGVQAPTLIGSTLFEQEKTREGGDLTVQWKPTEHAEITLNGFYSKLDASNVNDNYMYWGASEINGNGGNEGPGNVPTSFTVKNNTLVAAVWPGSHNGVTYDGLVVDNITRPHENSDTYYINLDGKFDLTDRLTVKGQIGYTAGNGDTPEQPAFEVDGDTQGISISQAGNGWVVTPVGINPQSPAGLSDDWSWNVVLTSKDTETYGNVDGDYRLDDGVFKDVAFGFHANDHTRQVDAWDRGCTLGANGACYGSPTMPFSATNPTSYPSNYTGGALGVPGLLIPIAGNPTTIGQIIDAIPGGIRGPTSAILQPQNYYFPYAFKVQETDYAGYVMARVQGEGWRGNFGVRLVDTQENAFVNSPAPPTEGTFTTVTTSAYGTYYVDHVNHDYFDVLPSANFTFDLQKNVALRVSAAETMSRPDYSALGGAVSLTDLTLTGNGGNPDLKPVKAAVFDGALEWYYAPTAVAEISLFYDDLSSYVGYEITPAVYANLQASGPSGPLVYSTFQISRPFNIAGQVKGVEMQIQQPLPYNFGFQANFTYADGSDANGQALVGTSKITYNVVGYYENKWLSARLAYTYRSSYYVGLDRSTPEQEAGNGSLDASVNFTLNRNVTLSVDGLNLTNSLLKYYAANTTQVRAVYENGTQVYAGIHFKF